MQEFCNYLSVCWLLLVLVSEESVLFIATTDEIDNDEVNEGERKNGDDDPNASVENGLFSFFNFGGVAGGGDVVDTTYNNEDDGN